MRSAIHAFVRFSSVALLALPCAAAPEPARLDYSAPGACPAQEAFAERVRQRGGKFDAPSAAGSRIDVVIREEGSGFTGSVSVENGGASSLPREVRSERCEEVADGLAVVVAITLQGQAEEARPATAASAAPAAPASTASQPKTATPPPPEPDPGKLETKGQFADETIEVDAGQLGVRFDSAVTLSAGAAYGLVPNTIMPRFDLTITRTNFITTPAGEGFIVGGTLRVRWTVLGPTRYETPGFTTDIFALKAGISGCSEFSYDRKGLVLLGCGEIAAGVGNVLTTADSGEETEEDQLQALSTAGFELAARYHLSPLVHLSVALGAEASLGELVARRPDGGVIFTTNPFLGYGTLGFGLHF